MEKIVDIIESIAHEKGLDIKEVRNTVTVALVKTAKKSMVHSMNMALR